MKLAQMQYFRAVCKYNNITKAAKELKITQPSVSNAIKELEEELGVRLFYRLNKGLSLTEEGRFFLEKTQDLLCQIEALTEQMRELGSRQKSINVGVPPMSGTFLFPYLFQSFRDLYPDINLSILEYGSMQIRALVANGTLDAAISAAVDPLHAERDEFESMDIMDTETLFCVSRGHRLASCKAVDLDMIRNEPLVLFKEDSYHTISIHELYRQRGYAPNVILYSSQLHTIKELVTGNIAASVLFQEVIHPSDGIVAIPFRHPFLTTIQLIWCKEKYLCSDIAKFIDFTRNYRLQLQK